MGYDYSFEYEFPGAMEGTAEGIATGIFLIFYLLMLGFSLVSYVLNAVGMYRIAKRRGIHHAWLAWIPIGNNWLLGSISDHYQYVAKKKVTGRRKILLLLNIILFVVTCLFAVGVAAIAVGHTGGTDGAIVLGVALGVITYLGMLGLSIAITVFCYIAYYDLFQSCRPNNSVLFLVLGILFNVTLPFFVFACSGSDKGMPARRAQQPPVQIPYQEPMAAEEEIPVVEAEAVDDPEM